MSDLSLAPRPVVAAPAPPMAGIGAPALARMLDVVDYAMMVVLDGLRVAFTNAIARSELDIAHPLRMAGCKLEPRDAREVEPLRTAVSNALQRGMQCMVPLGAGTASSMPVAVLPLREYGDTPAVLLVFGRRQVCEDMSTEAFARGHALTSAETRVLKLLCKGCSPCEIATGVGVKVSTVRTQICAIRLKTGARDIRSIIQQMSCLPPLPHLLRRAA